MYSWRKEPSAQTKGVFRLFVAIVAQYDQTNFTSMSKGLVFYTHFYVHDLVPSSSNSSF